MTRVRLRTRAQRELKSTVYGWDRLPRQLELIGIELKHASASESHTNAACGYRDIQAHQLHKVLGCQGAVGVCVAGGVGAFVCQRGRFGSFLRRLRLWRGCVVLSWWLCSCDARCAARLAAFVLVTQSGVTSHV